MAKSKNKLKVYISVDMEGITDVIHWNETNPGDDYNYYRMLMTKEANAAIEGAMNAGATEIVVRDAHLSKIWRDRFDKGELSMEISMKTQSIEFLELLKIPAPSSEFRQAWSLISISASRCLKTIRLPISTL